MPIPALLLPVLTELARNGLGMLAGAIQAKGKAVVEEQLGVKIPERAEDLTPELLQQLQIKQMEHEQFLVNAQLEQQKLELADVDSARKRDAEIVRATGDRNKRADAMIAGAATIVIAILAVTVWGSGMDDYEKGLITLILGRALGYIDQAFNFEFGTTRLSKLKDEAISRLSK